MDRCGNRTGQMVIAEAGSWARPRGSGGSPCVSQHPSGPRSGRRKRRLLSVLLLRRLQVLSPTLKKRNSVLMTHLEDRWLRSQRDLAWACFLDLAASSEVLCMPKGCALCSKPPPLFVGVNVAQFSLELTVWLKLTLNLKSSHLCLWNTGITGVCYHPYLFFFLVLVYSVPNRNVKLLFCYIIV